MKGLTITAAIVEVAILAENFFIKDVNFQNNILAFTNGTWSYKTQLIVGIGLIIAFIITTIMPVYVAIKSQDIGDEIEVHSYSGNSEENSKGTKTACVIFRICGRGNHI